MTSAPTNLTFAITAALAAAASFAVASVLQHRAAHREPSDSMVSTTLVLRLMQRPLWLVGALAGLVGIGLQALASHFGPLTLIQCLLVGNLILTVPLGAAINRRPVVGRDLLGVTLCTSGVIAFLVFTRPREGSSQISAVAASRVGLVIGVLIAVCLVLARRSNGDRRATLLGMTSGIVVGTVDALIKSSSDRAAGGFGHLFSSWPIYLLAVVGVGSVVLEQNALRAGRLQASLSAILVLEPIVGIAIGVAAFHESIVTGYVIIGEAIAAVTAVSGILLLSTRMAEQETASQPY